VEQHARDSRVDPSFAHADFQLAALSDLPYNYGVSH
jgi:hypothetical protein